MRGLCDQGKTRYVRGEPPLIVETNEDFQFWIAQRQCTQVSPEHVGHVRSRKRAAGAAPKHQHESRTSSNFGRAKDVASAVDVVNTFDVAR